MQMSGAAAVLPGRMWAAMGRPSASNRITIGVVGWGMMGPANTKALLAEADCQVIAACDLDAKHLQMAVDTINQHYGNQDCKAYHDFREMMARKDIDAVIVATPERSRSSSAAEVSPSVGGRPTAIGAVRAPSSST